MYDEKLELRSIIERAILGRNVIDGACAATDALISAGYRKQRVVTTVRYSEEEFDRWLAAHDREVAEKAWDEGFMRANRLVNCRMCRGTTVPKINPYTV